MLATILGLVAFQALAAEPASTAVEVKFFLNPTTVLDAHYQPNHTLRTAVQVAEEPVTIRMQFLDGPGHELHQERWNIRLRKVQGQDYIELTFKRRYPMDSHLDTALAKAALFHSNPLEQIYRDTRAAILHQPFAGYDGRGWLGQLAFGIPPDTMPRWV